MTTLNEAILQVTGGPSVNEGLLAYYKDGGASADNLADGERQWLCAQLGVAVSDPTTNADLWMQYLTDYPGSLNDKQLAFWLDGGNSLEAAIRALFANGEEGTLYYFTDDFAGLYQDAAGTTPVTAVGQPVGLMLDRRFGLVRGSEIVTNGSFEEDTAWSKGTWWTISGGKAHCVNTGTNYAPLMQIGILEIGKRYAVSYEIEVLSGHIATRVGSSGYGPIRAESGTYIDVMECSGNTTFQVLASGGFSGNVDNVSIREIPGNHASQTTTTARPTLQRDANGKLYLDFDGVDDWLATGDVNLGASPLATLCAGVHRTTETQAGMLAELTPASGANPGAILLRAPNGVGAGDKYAVGGNNGVGSVCRATAVAGPVTQTVTGLYDVSQPPPIDAWRIRVDGGSPAITTTGNASTGVPACANAPFYIGSRGGTTERFHGRLYALVLRGGATSMEQVESVESFVSRQSGISGVPA